MAYIAAIQGGHTCTVNISPVSTHLHKIIIVISIWLQSICGECAHQLNLSSIGISSLLLIDSLDLGVEEKSKDSLDLGVEKKMPAVTLQLVVSDRRGGRQGAGRLSWGHSSKHLRHTNNISVVVNKSGC